MLNKPLLGTSINYNHAIIKDIAFYYLFNERVGSKIKDSITHTEGLLINNPKWQGQGLWFDGSDDYVDCGDIPAHNIAAGEFTVLVDVIFDATGSRGLMVKRSNDPAHDGYRLYTDGGATTKAFHAIDGSAGFAPASKQGSEITTGRHQLGMVVTGPDNSRTLKYYLDGREDYSISGQNIGAIPDVADSFKLGIDRTETDEFLGTMIMAAGWRRGLSASEMLEMYLNPYAAYKWPGNWQYELQTKQLISSWVPKTQQPYPSKTEVVSY